MKVVKKIIVVFALFLASVTYAQEKQSGATWEQTIKSIKQYKDKFKTIAPFAKTENLIFEINNTTMTIIFLGQNNNYAKLICPLIKLESAKKYGFNYYLSFTGRVCKKEIYKVKYNPNKKQIPIATLNEVEYYFSIKKENNDDESGKKVLNHFKHLAFLAAQKRE